MLWMCEENPFFSWIANRVCQLEYPPDRRYTKDESKNRSDVVPLAKRKPSAWIWRTWPKSEYLWDGEGIPQYREYSYTPTAYLVAVYLQQELGRRPS